MIASRTTPALRTATFTPVAVLFCFLIAVGNCAATSHLPPAASERGQEPQSDTTQKKQEKSSSESPSAVETADERTEALDGKLDESLTEFDGYLLRERRLLEERRTDQAASGVGNGEAGEAGEAGSDSGDGAGAVPSEESRSSAGGTGSSEDDPEREPQSSAGARVGGEEPSDEDNGRVPPDVGDGNDDDIVARQLREAAMKEKDPALREKLWDEYRAYKGGSEKN